MARMMVEAGVDVASGAREEASMGGMTRVMRDLENGIH
jgi:hypothetical protein